MTPGRWEQVKSVFNAAVSRPSSERLAFLADACQGDPALRHEVDSLLAADEQTPDFLEKPAVTLVPRDELDLDGAVGRRIGVYRIVRAIGRGGMGAVYLATRDDDAYRKEVAIKLLKRGMDSHFFVSRFRQERQILAGLDHANIARLIDGGTTAEGLPYLVMDYVEGLPLDQYCDTHRLSVSQRLMLFRTVCGAVNYAHQHLVVHRDLKPAHVLVTADGTPKLLDFGIAKLLDPEQAGGPGADTSMMPLMTPEYASPEQVRGETVTTASDVYTLGVLLYGLLTGRAPYRLTNWTRAEIARAVCEQEPAKPSTAARRGGARPGQERAFDVRLKRRLAGDLDTIVLRAMHKEPERRYSSVEQLSEDIGRHLHGEPVRARNDSVGYLTSRFIVRHRVVVGAAVLVTVSLVTGIVSTAREAIVARKERAVAERRFNDVRGLANALLFEIHDAIAILPGSTAARELLIKRAIVYLDRLTAEARDDLSLQRELAAAYERIGDVQGEWGGANLGDTGAARAHYAKAMRIREALAARKPGDLDAAIDLSRSYSRAGDMAWTLGDPRSAGAFHRRALALDERVAAARPGDSAALLRVARDHKRVGYMAGASGNASEGLNHCGRALAMLHALGRTRPDDIDVKLELSRTYSAIGEILDSLTSRRRDALGTYRRALAIDEALAAGNPLRQDIRHALLVDDNNVGDVLTELGDHARALDRYRRGLDIGEALASVDPANRQYRSDMATLRGKVGRALIATGDPAGAVHILRGALEIFNEIRAADPDNEMTRARLAAIHASLGAAYAARAAGVGKGRVAQRIAYWRAARGWFQKSRDAWLDLRNRGATTGTEAVEPDRLGGEIAGCDVALARLGATASR